MSKKTTGADIFLGIMILLSVAAIAGDRLYVSRLHKRFQELENERIATSNGLATAKIVDENLRHVRDLVFENMEFPGRQDSIDPEARLFEFITECINDLKLVLVSIQPMQVKKKNASGTKSYALEIEGDFFTIGELCAKFENSRLLISIEELEISRASEKDDRPDGTARIKARMVINTYRVKKT